MFMILGRAIIILPQAVSRTAPGDGMRMLQAMLGDQAEAPAEETMVDSMCADEVVMSPAEHEADEGEAAVAQEVKGRP
jgi:hypothetical protein